MHFLHDRVLFALIIVRFTNHHRGHLFFLAQLGNHVDNAENTLVLKHQVRIAKLTHRIREGEANSFRTIVNAEEAHVRSVEW